MSLTRVDYEHTCGSDSEEKCAAGWNGGRKAADVIAEWLANPPGSRKSRCISMISSAARSRANAIAAGSASITVLGTPVPGLLANHGPRIRMNAGSTSNCNNRASAAFVYAEPPGQRIQDIADACALADVASRLPFAR